MVDSNTAGHGAGIKNSTGSILIIDGSSVTNNKAIDSGGGGGGIQNSGIAYINNSTIANNESGQRGGGINPYKGTLYVMSSTITGNLASANGGGGICENEGKDIFVINSIIVNNYEGSGGTYTTNDIGGAKAGYTTNVSLYNSAYGVLLAGNSYEKVDCVEISKTTTPNAFAFYTDDPVTRPQLVEQSNGTWAATMEYNLMGGCDVYFDYTADGVVTVFGYGNDGSINYLIPESAGSGATKVTTYQDGSERKTGVIGALGTDNITPEYRVVELDDSWTINGNTAATWTVAEDGKSVTLTNNPLISFFLSPDNYINKEIIGTMKVETAVDDDIIGFVLGYQNITDENSDGSFYYDFILFDWKQITQSTKRSEWGNVSKTSEEGYTLSRMTAELTDVIYSGGIGDYSKYLWFHEAEEGKYEILGTKYGSGNGWRDNTDHNFKIHYTQNHIIIWIDGVEIFNVEGDLKLVNLVFITVHKKILSTPTFTQWI